MDAGWITGLATHEDTHNSSQEKKMVNSFLTKQKEILWKNLGYCQAKQYQSLF
jgi:hypothetical protein